MTKTATSKKATETVPTSNRAKPHWPWITLSRGLQCEPDPMWLSRHHVTTKKHPAAASQLPQQNLTPEVTRGRQETSLQLVCKHLAPELERLA